MNITRYTQAPCPELMALLLSADPDEFAIQAYINKASILVCRGDNKIIAVAVLSQQQQIAELKNIAVLESYQGRGLAKQMIKEAKALAKRNGAYCIEVGTGNSSLSQFALYQKCGFRFDRVERDFFKNYPELIYENGIRCLDMIYLSCPL
ncbi:MAG: GNAT family N-acetyltransferase [Cellvibrionaceae bacterium]|nr:GNAT family N-acetyltransferase [Cellvibrionaceae bacterium]